MNLLRSIALHRLLLLSAVPAFALPLAAASFSYTGAFTGDDNQATFTFEVPGQETVTMQTWSYAGGTNGAGMVIAGGGFDPVLTLFDSTGAWQGANNDGTGLVATDVITGNAFDSYLSLNLAPGGYALVLTESDNTAVDELQSDGFTQDGHGNFTCPEFLGVPGDFCDATPAFRNGNYAVDIQYADSASTPEPGTGGAMVLGMLAAATFAWRRFKRPW